MSYNGHIPVPGCSWRREWDHRRQQEHAKQVLKQEEKAKREALEKSQKEALKIMELQKQRQAEQKQQPEDSRSRELGRRDYDRSGQRRYDDSRGRYDDRRSRSPPRRRREDERRFREEDTGKGRRQDDSRSPPPRHGDSHRSSSRDRYERRRYSPEGDRQRDETRDGAYSDEDFGRSRMSREQRVEQSFREEREESPPPSDRIRATMAAYDAKAEEEMKEKRQFVLQEKQKRQNEEKKRQTKLRNAFVFDAEDDDSQRSTELAMASRRTRDLSSRAPLPEPTYERPSESAYRPPTETLDKSEVFRRIAEFKRSCKGAGRPIPPELIAMVQNVASNPR
eukprot:gnl/TRDRNA2_/TRDRNA2_33867_c0_seq2.p1 gnl/TRDRNA2_/TRDRNA2_33867_c0~~gnl/TRDRNA2_/TRDRNA2_33867_c0_seq2.p1  ORF type:complete len:337 (+),score=59.09 gnl/TRDRNA2_/TRDRNA2_33867_c0_seq2:102-1112(+)